VNIVTAPPAGRFAFKQSFSRGSRGLVTARTSIDTPELAGFSSKISYLYTRQDGYVKNISAPALTGDDEDFGAKADTGWNFALSWQAADNFSFDYNFDWAHKRDMPAAFQLTYVTPGFALGANANPAGGAYPFGPGSNDRGFGDAVLLGAYSRFAAPQAALCSQDAACVAFANAPNAAFGGAAPAQALLGRLDGIYTAAHNNVAAAHRAGALSLPYQGLEILDGKGHSLTASWDISPQLQLKSISAYREFSDRQHTDLSGGGYLAAGGSVASLLAFNGLRQSQHQFSQELQIIGSRERWDWVAGLYYFRERAQSVSGQTIAALLGQFMQNRYTVANSARALYGQGTYTPAFDERLHLSLGLRVTADNRRLTLLDGSGASGDFAHRYRSTTGGVTAAYDVTPDSNVYGKYSRGYTPGGFNARTTVANQRPFGSEYVDAYEIGWKSQGFAHRLAFNAAGFVNKYTDLQLSQFVPTASGVETVFSNVGKATIRGIEAEITIVPAAGLTVELQGGILDMRYDKYWFSSPASGFQPVDVSDAAHFPMAAKRSAALGVQYDFEPWRWGRLAARVDVAYNSGYQQDTLDTRYDRFTKADAFALVNGRLTLDHVRVGADGELELSLWGKNLTDEEYRLFASGAFGDQLGFAGATFNEPRSYGVDATYRLR
jgi:outer membrane receptor protein involved in Fe transport